MLLQAEDKASVTEGDWGLLASTVTGHGRSSYARKL